MTKDQVGNHSQAVTSREALSKIKRAVAAGRFTIGVGDMVFANIATFDVEEAMAAAMSCTPQGNEWVIVGNTGDRFVVALEGEWAAIVGYQR